MLPLQYPKARNHHMNLVLVLVQAHNQITIKSLPNLSKLITKKDTAVNGQNHIQIYVSDALNSGRNIYRDEQITQDKDYTITFNLAPNTNGSVRIVRDGETIINQTVKN